MNLKVEWTGSYPNLCGGEWIITYDNIELNVPDNIKHEPMNTHGLYYEWTFDEEWDIVWTTYEEGLDKFQWIETNEQWVRQMFEEKDIKVTDELLSELYDMISIEDWRYGSCGGCL